MADSVQLTDLDVIARYSIAVRSATADRDELVETLRADLAWLERGRSRTSTFREAAPADSDVELDDAEGSAHRAPVRATRAPAKKVPAKKIVTRRSTTPR